MLKEFKKLIKLMEIRYNNMIQNDDKLFDIIIKQWDLLQSKRKQNKATRKIYNLMLVLHGFDYRKFNYYSHFEDMKITLDNTKDILKQRNFILN